MCMYLVPKFVTVIFMVSQRLENYLQKAQGKKSHSTTLSSLKHLVSDLDRQTIKLTLPVPVLRDLKSVVVKEVLCALDHLQTLLEALRRHLADSDNTVAVGDLA
jgi:hypothetical protein